MARRCGVADAAAAVAGEAAAATARAARAAKKDTAMVAKGLRGTDMTANATFCGRTARAPYGANGLGRHWLHFSHH